MSPITHLDTADPYDPLSNKKLSYRRDTMLQRVLVLAKKWKNGTGRQYFVEIIGLFSTTVT